MSKSKTSFLVILVGIAAIHAAAANAQQLLNPSLVANPYSSLKTLTGYQPSVLASEQDAKKVYDSMPTSVFKGSSGCFERAHNWAVELNQYSSIKSMKVFLFFTERYKREFDYEWMYHVAPLIPVKQLDGSIKELVFDPTFTSRPSWVRASEQDKFDNKPIAINEWIKYFISPDVECPVIENYSEYESAGGQEKYYCYIMKAPMFNYIPANFDDDQAGLTFAAKDPKNWSFFDTATGTRKDWRDGDLTAMKKGLRPTK
jgi:hypothetical protein